MSSVADTEAKILFEMETEHRAMLTINRPDRLNTFTGDMWSRIRQLADELDAHESARVAVLTGAGDRAFSAGLDISPDNPAAMQIAKKGSKRSLAEKNRRMSHSLRRGASDLTAFENLRMPTIAAINGHCIGVALE